jgi:hypothetical protein
MCADREHLVSVAREAEDLKELAKTDDDAHHRRTQLLLELEANGETTVSLLGPESTRSRCLSETHVSLPTATAVFI